MKRFSIAVGLSALVLLACTSISGNAVTIEHTEIESDEGSFMFSAEVPQVYGLEDHQTQIAINERLKVIVERQKRMFMRDVKNLSEVQTGSTLKSSLIISYKDGRNDEDVVSLIYIVSPYLFDAAHPNHFTIPYNYDVKYKKEIDLETVVRSESMTDLSSIVSKKLLDHSKAAGTYSDAKETFVRDGAGPDADNFRSFVLRENGIDFYFDPYQVGPYAEGLISVSFSGGTLENLLTEHGKHLLGLLPQESSQ